MKKQLKIILFSVAIAFVTFILYLNYQTSFSDKASTGEANIKNIRKIEIGMTVKEVISIMGQPSSIDSPDSLRYPYTQYNYETNDESFANVTISFDSIMKVKETFYPKKYK